MTIPDEVKQQGLSIADQHPSKQIVAMANAALARAIASAQEEIASNEVKFSHNGIEWVVQVGRKIPTNGNDDSYYFWRDGWPTAQKVKKNSVIDSNPPTPFRFECWPVGDTQPAANQITQWFGANPDQYEGFGLPGHEGVDLRAAHGAPILCVADGVVKVINESRRSAREGGHNYGVHVRVEHRDGYETIYAHFDRHIVQVGQQVRAGERLGFADNTGNSSGSHLHLTLKKRGANIGYDHEIIDPMPFLFDLIGRAEGKQYIDLLPFLRGEPNKAYMVRNNNGHSERYQVQLDSADQRGWTWYITKNSQWEKWLCTGEFIRLALDTSPEPENGIPAYYQVIDYEGREGGRWCRRFMFVGETFDEQFTHRVTFYDKRNGNATPDRRSGINRNRTTLFSADAREILIGGTEKHRYRLGYGRVGWESPWGSAIISADDPGSYNNQRESITYPQPIGGGGDTQPHPLMDSKWPSEQIEMAREVATTPHIPPMIEQGVGGGGDTTYLTGVNVGHYPELPLLERQRQLLTGWPVVRFMDWQQINRFNNSPAGPTNMQELPQASDNWNFTGGPWHSWKGVPLDVILDTAIALNTRPWLCIPHTFTAPAMEAFVNYVCNRMTGHGRPIFEFSNEVWNGAFKQHHDLANLTPARDANPLKNALKWYAQKSAELAQAVNGRGDVVLCGQATNSWILETVINHLPPLTGQAKINAIAIAPYWQGQEEIWKIPGHLQGHRNLADQHQLKLWCYEGGQHLRTVGSMALNRSKEMGVYYYAYLEMLDRGKVDLRCLYSIASIYQDTGSWGLYEIVKNNNASTTTTSTAKLDAVRLHAY